MKPNPSGLLMVVVAALLTAVPAAALSSNGAAPESWRAQVEAHLTGLQATCDKLELRHAAQKILDLLVAGRIREPAGTARLPLPEAFSPLLTTPGERMTDCKDHMAQGLIAAFQGDFDAALPLLSRKPEGGGWCGNALAAEMFGSAEAVASVAFLRGLHADVVTLRLPETPGESLESVNVRSSRLALAYAMRAAASEQLGRTSEAIHDSCIAAEQAEDLEESWNYYYSPDPIVWQEITTAVAALRKRLGGHCS